MYDRHNEAVLQWLASSLDMWATQHDNEDSTKVGSVVALEQENGELRYCTIITSKHLTAEVVDVRARFNLAISGVPDSIEIDLEASGVAPQVLEGKERPYCIVSAHWYTVCPLPKYDDESHFFGEFIYVGDNETVAQATVRAVSRKMNGTLREVVMRYDTLVEFELL